MTLEVTYSIGANETKTTRHENVQEPGWNPQLNLCIIKALNGDVETFYILPRVIKIDVSDVSGLLPASAPVPKSSIIPFIK